MRRNSQTRVSTKFDNYLTKIKKTQNEELLVMKKDKGENQENKKLESPV
jgi:hypothetical protein